MNKKLYYKLLFIFMYLFVLYSLINENDYVQFTAFTAFIIPSVLYCFYLLIKKIKQQLIKKSDYYYIFPLLFLAVVTRVYQLKERSLWLDEDEPIGEILGYYPTVAGKGLWAIVRGTAYSQQPALDYLFEALGLFAFGVNEWGARGHALVFGVLSVLLFYVLFNYLIKDRLFSFFSATLLNFHPLLIYYSQEGRPNSSAVFFSLVFLFSVFLFFKEKISKENIIFLTLSQIVFLFIIGLQPPILIGLSLVVFAVVYFNQKDKLKIYLKSYLLSMLVYAPYLIFIFYHSQGYISLGQGTDSNGQIPAYLKFLLGPFAYIYFISFILLLFHFSYKLLKNKKLNFLEKSIFSCYVLFTGFLLTTYLLFEVLINWLLQERYLIIAVPLVFIAMMGTIYIVLFKNLKPINAIKKYHQRLCYLILLSLIYYPLIDYIKVIPKSYGHVNKVIHVKTNWKKIYSTLKEKSSKKDIALLNYFVDNQNWAEHGLLLKHFYLHNVTDVAHAYSQWDYDDYISILDEAMKKEKGDYVFVVIRKAAPFYRDNVKEFRTYLNELKNDKDFVVNYVEGLRYVLVQLKQTKSVAQTLIKYHEVAVKAFKHQSELYRTYGALSLLYSYVGENQKSEIYLKKMEDFNSPRILNDINQLKYYVSLTEGKKELAQ